jgi:molecular chaperone DnaJ
LLVEVVVSRHPNFQRDNYDLYSTENISFAQAALGGDIRVKTVDGEVLFNIKPGTQTGTKIRLRGKGVPSLRNSSVRGDQYTTLVVQVPTKLSGDAKEALRQFDALTGNTLKQEEPKQEKSEKTDKKKKKSFMDKVKEALDE